MNDTELNFLDRPGVIPGSQALLPTAAGCLGFLIFIGYLLSGLTKPKRRMPPGPKPKPIIGNLLDVPPAGATVDEYYTKHRDLYGPISSLKVFGTTIIVVNDAQVAHDLMDKRSVKYAGRPHLEMAGQMVGFNRGMIFTQPGDRFREMRRIVHNQLGSTTTVSRWQRDIDNEVRHYLLRVMKQPELFQDHIRKEAGSIILKIMFGYTVNPHEADPMVDLAEQVMDDFSEASVPGKWMVDLIPALAKLPSWMPGTGFQRTAKQYSERLNKMAQTPYDFTKRQLAQGLAPISVVSEAVRKLGAPPTAQDDDIISWAAMGMLAGGADTTVAVMEILYLAMLLYPEVLRKAQAEIDAVLGQERLPDENDRERLPYLDALLKEIIRWEPISEMGVPHAAVEDDQFGDYFIPKDSMIIVNLYGLYHDPATYADPAEFRPERFLGAHPEPDPYDLIWGFGRRICPGRHLAVWNLWLQVTRTIAVFDITPVAGKPAVRKFTTGLVRRPVPFVANIKVRSPQLERLVKSVEEDAPLPAEGDSKLL